MTDNISSPKPVFKSKQVDSFKQQLKELDNKKFSGLSNNIAAFFSPKKKLFKKRIKRIIKKTKTISKKNPHKISEIVEILDKNKKALQEEYEMYPDDDLEDSINRINGLIKTILPSKKVPVFEAYNFQKALLEINDFFLSLAEVNQINFVLKKNQTINLLKKEKNAARRKVLVNKFIRDVKKVIG